MRADARTLAGRSGVVALFLALSAAAQVDAQTFIPGSAWSAVGSVGIVDESKLSLVDLNDAVAGIRSTAPAGSVVYLRYPVPVLPWQLNVMPVGQLAYEHLTLSITFSKNEDAAFVVAQLRRVRLADGASTGYVAVDSVSSLPMGAVQTVEQQLACGGPCIDLAQYAYFVQVTLLKSTATAVPRLVAVRVTLH